MFVVGTHLIYQKYVNSFIKKVVFNTVFFFLITIEYVFITEFSLPYLYIFRIAKLFISLTVIRPNFFKWSSALFERYWTVWECYTEQEFKRRFKK